MSKPDRTSPCSSTSPSPGRKSDPGLEEIRRVRHEISAEVGHVPRRLLKYYRKVEVEYADRLVRAEEGAGEEPRTTDR
jgi:hypothetical protein